MVVVVVDGSVVEAVTEFFDFAGVAEEDDCPTQSGMVVVVVLALSGHPRVVTK